MGVAAPFRRTLEDIAGEAGDVIIIIIGIIIFYALITIGKQLWGGLQGLFGGIQSLSLGQGAAGTQVPAQYGQPPGTTYGPVITTPPYGPQQSGMVTYAGGKFYSGQRISYVTPPTPPPTGIYAYTPAALQQAYHPPGGTIFITTPSAPAPSFLAYAPPPSVIGGPGIIGPATPVYGTLPGGTVIGLGRI